MTDDAPAPAPDSVSNAHGDEHESPRNRDRFATTRWSMVLAAGTGRQSPSAATALRELCEIYWYPVYCYVRRRSASPEDASDRTQTFFSRLIEKQVLGSADPDRGRFRAFLLTACRRFLANTHRDAAALKRGGGKTVFSLDAGNAEARYLREPAGGTDPERHFERQWAVALLEHVMAVLAREYRERGKSEQFELLKSFLTGTADLPAAAAGESLGLTEGAVRVAVHRLKQRYRELIRAEIAQTVRAESDIDDEVRRLFAVLSSS